MESFDELRLRSSEADCLEVIEYCGARLDVENTGRHYRLASGLHTGTVYQISRVLRSAATREVLMRHLSGGVLTAKEAYL